MKPLTRNVAAVGAAMALAVGLAIPLESGLTKGGVASAAAPTRYPQTVTLVFPSEILGPDEVSSSPVTAPYPPSQDDAGYVVPADARLVIESIYVTSTETWDGETTGPRDYLVFGASTWYPDPTHLCQFPLWERDYGIPITGSHVQDEQTSITKSDIANLSGPIYVEGGRELGVNGQGYGGNSYVHVMAIVHGYLEAAQNPSNPAPPSYDCS